MERETAQAAPTGEQASSEPRCACCRSRECAPHLKGLLRCARCGHVWADVRLSHEELSVLYARDYYEGEEYLDYAREEPALMHNFALRIAELQRRHARGGRLWEIGCAYGFFLRQAGRTFEAAGCDISQHAVDYARARLGVDAHCIDYLQFEPPAPYDIVCMWDTIEHLQDPELYIAKAARDLRAGGTLALETGDIGSWLARRRGERWRLIHPPTHLHYFTVRSITSLLEHNGFTHIRVHHAPFWRHADAVAYRLLGTRQNAAAKGIYDATRRLGLLNFCFPLQTGDLMQVYAQKA